MQGSTHGITGATAGLWAGWASGAAVAPWAALATRIATWATSTGLGLELPRIVALSIPEQAAFAFYTAGAAMIADVDTKASTASRVWGPLSELLTAPIRLLVSHRRETHYLIVSSLIAGVLAFIASLFPIASAVLVAWITGLALAGLDDWLPGDTSHAGVNLLLSAGAGSAAYAYGWFPWWLPFAVVLGVMVHVLGDSFTTARVRTAGGRKWGLGLFDNGAVGERLIIVLCLIAVVAWVWLFTVLPIVDAVMSWLLTLPSIT